MMSPIRIRCLAFLTTTPLRMIAPAVQRREARERLLAKRANHSHWSRRRLVGLSEPLLLK